MNESRRWRVAALPIAARAALLAGGAVHVTVGDAAAQRVPLVGLIATGAPAAWQTLREMLRGHFASDIVAMLAVVAADIMNGAAGAQASGGAVAPTRYGRR